MSTKKIGTNGGRIASLVYLINKIHGSRMLKQRIWPPNHRFHTKVYFNEVVANALRDNIGIGMEAVRGQTH